MNNKKKFSNSALQSIKEIYTEIINHPFNVEMAKGTLSKKIFNFYKKQDKYFLKFFSKSLCLLATKLDNINDIKKVLEISNDCFKENLSLENIENFYQISPSNFNYTNFLLNTATHGTAEELSATLLPCHWIYFLVAKDLRKRVPINTTNPYKDWFSYYTSSEYKNNVDFMIFLTNKLYKQANTSLKKKMHFSFIMASQLELNFWQDCYTLKKFILK